MAEDTLARLRTKLPELFSAAMRRIEQRASAGDEDAARRLEEVGEAGVPSLLRLPGEGGGELWFSAGRRGLSECEPAAATEFGYALEVPVAAARYALSQADRGAVDVDEVVMALASLGSRGARGALASQGFGFRLSVLEVPVLGTLRVQVGFGRPQIAARPEFSLSIESDELEDAREQGIAPHQLFLAGKVRIDGDVAKAMQLAMVLAQLKA